MKRFKEIIQSTVEPSNTNVLWLNPDINELLYYSSNGWSPVSSASKEEIDNAIAEHRGEMETFSEQCKVRFVTLNFGTNEETMQLANINGPALVLDTVIMSNVERVYMSTSSMVKEDITGYTASSSTTSKIIEAYSFATFDIVRSGSGTASVGLKFKVQ